MSRLFNYLNPYRLFKALEELDRTSPSYSKRPSAGSRTTLAVLVSVCVSLLMLDYLKNSGPFEFFIVFTHELTWLHQPFSLEDFQASTYWDLMRFMWWSLWHVITFVLIPIVVIKCYLKQSVWDFGWRWGDTHRHWRGYLALLSPIVALAICVSFRSDFTEHYPFYGQAKRSLLDLIAWEALYLVQFACLEFFFRGYILTALRPYYGVAAIWIMLVPYVMIHFGKPWLEATGAIFFGLFLGILALRSKSIWGGFGVHAGLAISMDLLSLYQQDAIPKSFWTGV